ncbi:MAG: type II toxin-antitoxin system VapC family toxin [Kiritimatiellae bacterium]|jgi:predicted nucleic acid-binding protein|nr:type II toxin-antitoxin system VapC family toxin [Kiritimatiellia bacterium]
MKTRIYIETSVISYMTAKPARDITLASRQAFTHELWNCLDEYEVYISELVIQEASSGNEEAAKLRLNIISHFDELVIDDEARELAATLIIGKTIPDSFPEDALHIATAAANGIYAIVTWNFKHINNPFTKNKIRKIIEKAGYVCPEMCSPEELMRGGEND